MLKPARFTDIHTNIVSLPQSGFFSSEGRLQSGVRTSFTSVKRQKLVNSKKSVSNGTY